MGKKREKKKYNIWLGDPNYDDRNVKLPAGYDIYPRQTPERYEGDIPPQMRCSIRGSPGLFLGLPTGPGESNYVGVRQGAEGNFMVVGGNGSGKSTGIAMPTARTWQGAICATDIKGEFSDWYGELYQCGLVSRRHIVFDPMQVDGPSYDPFWWLLKDDQSNLFNNVMELAIAIAPVSPEDKQPFWAETEQGVLAAALLYYFKLGLSFSETMCVILSSSTTDLCKTLTQSGDVSVKMLLGETASMKPETVANFDRGLRNKIMVFAADPYISHAFRGQREGANCFTWDDLDCYNIFLRIPADKVEQWSGAVNLMYTQLIRHLERRPEMHSPEGAGIPQTLLLMDEFARFGKLEMITAAMATLRSKKVNICLMVQSIAQLDKIYGEKERRIIVDNCQYRAILQANDPETQKYICEMIGTHMRTQLSGNEHMDLDYDTTGYSRQSSEIRELVVQPHKLSTLDDVLLLTPYGFYRAKKFCLYDNEMRSMLLTDHEDVDNSKPIPVDIAPGNGEPEENKEVKIMSIEKRTANANRHIAATEQKKRQEERAAQEAQRRKDSRRNYIIGEVVSRYFPDIRNFEPGTGAENLTRFEPLEAFLYVLSTDYDLVEELQGRATQLVSENPDGEWRMTM